jgi:hypothetical protein
LRLVLASGIALTTFKAPSGFEPLYGEEEPYEPHDLEPRGTVAPELPAELQRIVERLTRSERERA